MRISLLAVGTRLPAWINDGFENYRRRLPPHVELNLEEIPAGQRKRRGDVVAATALEGEQQLRRAEGADRIIALDERGQQCSTAQLADYLDQWMREAPRVALLVGGPDGLAPECLRRAHERWALSRLTLPHGLVRVLVAEQIYRAWTLLQGHPYHRP